MNAILKKKFTSLNFPAICFAPSDSINHLDHLAVISYILHIPFITDEESHFLAIQKYYPQITPLFIPKNEQILTFLAKDYEIIFTSAGPHRKQLSSLFEILFKKEMLFWYCPHGHSDKPIPQFLEQHFAFTYGDQMEDRLKEIGAFSVLKSHVRTGNYRFPFYHAHEKFYDSLVEKEVFSHFKKEQKTILYAPTWQDFENSSSLFEISLPILNQLPDHYNMIVKLHPWLEDRHPGQVHLIKEKYQDKPNIVVLCQYPLVLPILKRTHLYLGDFSSIGYDFLYYDRPMFFIDSEQRLDKDRKTSNYLHHCGIVIPPTHYHDLFTFIESNEEKQSELRMNRMNLFRYAFDHSKEFSTIRDETIQAITEHKFSKK